MTVDLAINDRIAIVTLNRPEALNAFNTQQLKEVVGAFGRISEDRSVRAVILTGAGEKAFAAGADIKEMVNLDREGGLQFGRLGHAATWAVESLPQPVIAAVNGFAMGGGCELALAADIRICSENAVFAQPEVGLGIPPGWGGSQRLTRAVGPG
ncbi:MAG: enoyl-CoA hydratase-related protein, partial [Chloroflexota bacterium]|nr:enoyl-CoA hydratase-related protein [Chloroflexota bacterium]